MVSGEAPDYQYGGGALDPAAATVRGKTLMTPESEFLLQLGDATSDLPSDAPMPTVIQPPQASVTMAQATQPPIKAKPPGKKPVGRPRLPPNPAIHKKGAKKGNAAAPKRKVATPAQRGILLKFYSTNQVPTDAELDFLAQQVSTISGSPPRTKTQVRKFFDNLRNRTRLQALRDEQDAQAAMMMSVLAADEMASIGF
jgi:hypothetical protein